MLDLEAIYKSVDELVANGEVTEADAKIACDNMINEQVNDLILDIYDAFIEGSITDSDANIYLDIALEAVKGDKLSNKAKDKIDDELKTLPDKERKVVEDSIRKASKEAGNRSVNTKALSGINEIVKSKKKVVKESEETIENSMLDIDAELNTFEEKMSEETKKNIKDIAIAGTITAAIATPFVLTGAAIIKQNNNFKKANKASAAMKEIEYKLEDLGKEFDKNVAELNKKFKALYKKYPILNKYYIPKEKKSVHESLNAEYDKLVKEYNRKSYELCKKYDELKREFERSMNK